MTKRNGAASNETAPLFLCFFLAEVEIMIMVDKTGQFVVSTARYLHAIDPKKFANSIDKLIKAAIEKDRERVYLGDLAASIWGTDYKERAEELKASDDNFRRIYKRLYPVGM